jgi:hypothetical protein
VALHEIIGKPLVDIYISYQHIFMLINDNRVNTSFSPNKNVLASVLNEYATAPLPDWIEGKNFTNFKRNFHIFEWTGLFRRDKHGLMLQTQKLEKVYSYIQAINAMTINFNGFDDCYGQVNISNRVKNVVSSLAWGYYYDALTLPMHILYSLSCDIDESELALSESRFRANLPLAELSPEMRSFQSNQPRASIFSGNTADSYEIMILREKANCEHARILNLLAARLRFKNIQVFENTFIDLLINVDNQTFIFEVKSNHGSNTLSQIRKAIGQLYEYRYRINKPQATLCIVLQERPSQDWIVNYLVNDRKILVCWLVDEVRVECTIECDKILLEIGVIG